MTPSQVLIKGLSWFMIIIVVVFTAIGIVLLFLLSILEELAKSTGFLIAVGLVLCAMVLGGVIWPR